MVASNAIHLNGYASKEMPSFLESSSSTTWYVNASAKRDGTLTKVVQPEEIVYIEGTVSVAF